jgi:hypothetical protein
MNIYRQFLSYVLLAGIAIPSFSMAMNPAALARATAARVKNFISDSFTESFEDQEVKALKAIRLDQNHEAKNQRYAILGRDILEFRALADRNRQINIQRDPLRAELALPATPLARKNQILMELGNLNVEEERNLLLINLYEKIHTLYGVKAFDTNGPNTPVHTGPFAINNTIAADMIAAMGMRNGEIIVFPTEKTQAWHREHGLIKGFIYPISSKISRKIVLINVNEFNRLTASQRKDRLSHVLGQFKQQEAQWRILQKQNRERMIFWAKRLPYIIAACGVAYYWMHYRTDILPYTMLSDLPGPIINGYNSLSTAAAQAGNAIADAASQACSQVANTTNWVRSFTPWPSISPVPVVITPPGAVQQFCDAVIGMLSASGRAIGSSVSWMNNMVFPPAPPAPILPTYWEQLRAIITFIYEDFAKRTPYELKTMSSAAVGSWAIDKIGTQYNKLQNILDSYRTDKIVCQQRGEQGLAGVYERCGQDVARNNGGIPRIAYLWLQKKLGRI